MIRRQVQVGSATRSDTLRARLELANARQAVLQGENSLRAAEFALGRQIGVGEPVRAMPPEDLAPRPLELTMEEILQLAEDVSPLVRVARASASSASAEVKSARSVYLPNLNLSSGYGWNNDTAAFSGGRTSWNLRLSMSYPIFNGFSREASVQRASEAERVARLQETDARLLAREQADGALQALLTAEAAIGIANEAAAVAEEDLRIVNERYRVGVATILDLVTSQVALQEAEANLVAARYDYAVARADLQAILGREL
jgi:outer membrane protein TolC